MQNFRNNYSQRMVIIMTGVVLSLLMVVGGSQSRSVSDDSTSPMEEELLEVLDGTNPEAEADDSRELCPEGSAFHKETSKCHALLEKGPCGQLQVFYSLRKTPQYGDCGCMSNSDGCSPRLTDGVSNRMILMGPDRKHCFMAYSRGPCRSGEWYILDPITRKPECQKNPCCKFTKQQKASVIPISPSIKSKIQSQLDVFTFVSNGTCYRTFSQAFCKFGQYAQFLGTNDPYPKCYVTGPPICQQGIFGAGPQVGMPCEAGYKLIGDDCVVADVGFD